MQLALILAMTTPSGVGSLQIRKKGQKRPCIDPVISPSIACDFDGQVELLMKNDSIPDYIRAILGRLLDDRKQMLSLMTICKDLADQVKELRAENVSLRSQANVPIDSHPPSIPLIYVVLLSLSHVLGGCRTKWAKLKLSNGFYKAP